MNRSTVSKLQRIAILFALAILACGRVAAQSSQVQARITNATDVNNLVTLKGNTHQLARPEFDRGPAPLDLALNRMLLVLTRSPEQEVALKALLDQQQDKSSPNYHRWLTPQQFGQQFGPADSDIAQVTAWLESYGFHDVHVANGRVAIEFSGTASQLESAFHTSIHKFVFNGEEHWANASDPQIPAALAPVVAGVFTLHNFLKAPQIQLTDEKFTATVGPNGHPQFSSSSGLHALVPADYWRIYNFGASPPNTFAHIAIVARSNINTEDVLNFHNYTFDQAFVPQVIVNGPDPGDLGGGEEAEAVLDSTWSAAAAPSAPLFLVVSQTTATTDGVDLSEMYIIDNNLADVMTESFGTCEADLTSAEAAGVSSLAQQAATQGIAYVVSAGDSGSAGCDNPRTETVASQPPSVNVLASTPYTVAVGGTMFNEGGNPSTYWSPTNNPLTLESVISYIPENVWNESCAQGAAGCSKPNIAAGGGGPSSFFSKPSWQAGVSGIPADNHRDLPDVSLTAAGHDPYLICLRASCVPNAQGQIFFVGVSGTSASAPAFAGILALANQQTFVRLGQPNYVLYRLAAAENLAQCNASNTTTPPASTCIFNDVTVGSNAVPGETGYGTASALYQTGVGYDMATGLGSINVSNLVSQWNSVVFNATSTTFSLSPPDVTHGSLVNISGSVAPNGNNGQPTGVVWITAINSNLPVHGNYTGGNTLVTFPVSAQGTYGGTTNALPGGAYNVSAHYAGDGTFGGSDAPNSVFVDISAEPTTVTFTAMIKNSSGVLMPFTSAPFGTPVYFQAQVNGQSGVGNPSGNVNFYNNQASEIWAAPLGTGGTAVALPDAQIPAGNYSVTPYYVGDNSFLPSWGSSPINFTIAGIGTTTALVSQQNSQGLLLNATVTATSAGSAPTGLITFSNGNTVLGTIGLNGGNPSGGTITSTASFNGTQLQPGQYNFTASYAGDANYGPSVSATVQMTLIADFTIANQGIPSLTVIAGNPANYINDIVVTPLFGYSATVTVSCTTNAPKTTCTPTPASLPVSNGNVNIGSIMVTTTSNAEMVVREPAGRSPFDPRPASIMLAIVWLLLFLARFAGTRRRRFAMLALVLIVVTVGIAAVGCGGGGSTATPPPPPQGTPPNTYTVTVTGTANGTSHSTNLTLVVQ